MKPTDFIVEGIAEDAHEMDIDNDVQMARADCYNAAKYAIQLHKLLSGQSNLDGWISEKITLANDYLRTVAEYLEHESTHDHEDEMMFLQFSESAMNFAVESLINETTNVTDYNPPSQGGTRKELLAKYAKTGDSKDAVAARKAGATQKELQAARQEFTKKHMTSEEAYYGPAPTGTPSVPANFTIKTNPSINAQFNATQPVKGVGFGGAGKDVQSGGNVAQVKNFNNPQWMRSRGLIPQDDIEADLADIKAKEQSGYYDQNMNETAKNRKQVSETASCGGTSAGGIAINMTGVGGKPDTGKPKKIGNAHKPKKIQVGKGVY